MLLKRLYSSLPPSRTTLRAGTVAGTSSQASRTVKLPTRGRARPVRVAPLSPRPVVRSVVAQGAAKVETSVSFASTMGRGRRLRRGLLSRNSSDCVSSELAYDPNGFQPIRLYPFQMGLHLSMTPSHMPLPVHVGTSSYTSPGGNYSGPLFELPPSPSPASALATPGAEPEHRTGLGEHLRVSRSFAHPALTHHLGLTGPQTNILDVDADSHLATALEDSRLRLTQSNERDWSDVLARLGSLPSAASATAQTLKATQKQSMEDAMSGLHSLLARLEFSKPNVDDEVVQMDSVKRKRRKKINKHKYKKRRKATRAERKRLGK